jgi:hypothetical protein
MTTRDVYDIEGALWGLALDQQDEGDETLLRLVRRISRAIEAWDQDPCDPDAVEAWDGDALAMAPTKLLALADKLPDPWNDQLRTAVRTRQESER